MTRAVSVRCLVPTSVPCSKVLEVSARPVNSIQPETAPSTAAIAMTDPCGFTPGGPGRSDASAILRSLRSWMRPNESVTHRFRSSPMGHDENKWMVIRFVRAGAMVQESWRGLLRMSMQDNPRCLDTKPRHRRQTGSDRAVAIPRPGLQGQIGQADSAPARRGATALRERSPGRRVSSRSRWPYGLRHDRRWHTGQDSRARPASGTDMS